MAGKKNFVLRMDEHMYRALERWASDEFRSVNGQIEWLLDKALKEAGRKKPKDDSSPGADQPTEDAPGSD